MKKIILSIAAMLTISASAQITTIASTKTVAMYDQKDTWLNMTIDANGDTTYAIRLRSTYAYSNTAEVIAGAQEKSHVLVDLGKREQAIAILQSMIDFKGDDRTLVTLNNPSENAALYSNGIHGRGFIIADRWNVEKEFVKVSTLEKVLTDIQNIKPGMDIKDQKAIQEQKSSAGIIAAVVVGIGIATYFLIRIMSL
jgi:hypothetical protein